MDLNFAVAIYQAKGITFEMFTFMPYATDVFIRSLNQIDPQFTYRHRKNGTTRHETPDEYRSAHEKAVKAREAKSTQIMKALGGAELTNEHLEAVLQAERDIMQQCQWERLDDWTDLHRLFITLLPSTVSLKFTDNLPDMHAKLLQYFWQTQPANIPGKWKQFGLLSKEAVDLWAEAYLNTRQTVLHSDTMPELEATSDPNSSGGG